MRTILALLALLSLAGCYHTLPEPMVTNIAYDDRGSLVVTKCPVHWTNYLFFAVTSVDVAPHLSTDTRSTDCHYDHLAPPTAATGAPLPSPRTPSPS